MNMTTPSLPVQRIVCARTGGPEVLELHTATLAAPQAHEVRIRHEAIGVNFLDVYVRSGLYPTEAPFTPGVEAAGVIEAIGSEVSGMQVGERVVYATPPMGAYASARNLAAERVVCLPTNVSAHQAAATMLKGMSAHYLLHDSYRVQAGSTVVVHAATGGVGSLLVPWAKHKGAKVIALVGAATKVARAHALGADVVVDTATDEWIAAVLHATAGRGADCVYDSVGKDTFGRSLACLRVRGTLVSYGQSSGAVPPVDVLELGKKSVFLTRPSLWDHTSTRSELLVRAAAVHQLLAAGVLSADVGQVWPLAQAADAHRALQARTTHGSTLLVP